MLKTTRLVLILLWASYAQSETPPTSTQPPPPPPTRAPTTIPHSRNERFVGTVVEFMKRIGLVQETYLFLKISPEDIAPLRADAQLTSTYRSTQMSGSRLNRKQVEEIINGGYIPGMELYERAVKGYHAALGYIEQVTPKANLTEEMILTLNEYVTLGKKQDNPNPFNTTDGKELYTLLHNITSWINFKMQDTPCPVVAGVAHFQVATLAAFPEGCRRTGRLLVNLILHLCEYDLGGMYTLDPYYVETEEAYEQFITKGQKCEDVSAGLLVEWVEYFLRGMAVSFEDALAAIKQRVVTTTESVPVVSSVTQRHNNVNQTESHA